MRVLTRDLRRDLHFNEAKSSPPRVGNTASRSSWLSMLWRGYQVLRHFQHIPCLYTTQALLLLPSPHLSIRCATATALKIRTIHPEQNRPVRPQVRSPQPSAPGTPAQPPSQPRQKKWRPPETGPKDTSWLANAAHLPEALDQLFEKWKAGDSTIKELRLYARELKVYYPLLFKELAVAFAELMVTSAKPQRAHHVLVLAHAFGLSFSRNVYEEVLYQLDMRGHWSHMPSVVSLARQHTGGVNTRMLNWRLRALVELSHFHRLPEVLEEFRRDGLKPTRRTFHYLISGYLMNRDLRRAKECLHRMEQVGFPIDATTHAVIISAYRSLGPDKAVQRQAFAVLRELIPRDGTRVLNSLIRICLDARDLNGALQYLSAFDDHVPSPERTGGPGGDSTVDDGRYPQIAKTLKSPNTTPTPNPYLILPDVATFTMIIAYMAQAQDFSRAMYMVEQMRKLGVEADGGFAASLVRLYVAIQDFPTALAIVASICKHIPEAQAPLIELGLNPSDVDRVDPILSNVRPSHEPFHALLYGIQKTHGFNGVFLVLASMRAAGLVSTERTVEATMAELARSRKLSTRDLARFLRALPPNARPSLHTINIVLRSMYRDELDKVKTSGWMALANRVRQSENQPIDGSAASEDRELVSTEDIPFDPLAGIQIPDGASYASLVRPVTKALYSRRIRTDRETLALRLRYDGVINSDMSSAKDTFRQMVRRGMLPNEYHYAALMEGYALSGDMRAVEMSLETAINNGIAPNVVLYTIVINGYARQGNSTQASRVFHKMLSAGIRPDVGAIDAVVSAYFAAGETTAARSALLDLWSYVGPCPTEEESSKMTIKQLAQTFRALGRIVATNPDKEPMPRGEMQQHLSRIMQRFSTSQERPVIKLSRLTKGQERRRERDSLRRTVGSVTSSFANSSNHG